jgi:hypothetical protein
MKVIAYTISSPSAEINSRTYYAKEEDDLGLLPVNNTRQLTIKEFKDELSNSNEWNQQQKEEIIKDILTPSV